LQCSQAGDGGFVPRVSVTELAARFLAREGGDPAPARVVPAAALRRFAKSFA
jgi:hypothetical protein